MNRIKKFLILVSIILVLSISFCTSKAVFMAIFPTDYSQYVEKYCYEYNIEPTLAYAVIKTESGFDPHAISSAEAKGLMQLTDDTFEWLQWKKGVENAMDSTQLYDPKTNIEYGVYLLSYLCEKYNGDYKLVLSAYHAGSGNVACWLANEQYSSDGVTLDVIPTPDTRNYFNKVSRNIKFYDYLYDF